LPELPKGFRSSPLNSWWKLTDSMARRVVKYGLKDEVLEKARKMCKKDFEDQECPEFEEIKEKLEKIEKAREKLREYIGEKETFPFAEGEVIVHPTHGVQTRILKKYIDLMNNERVLTELTDKHIKRRIKSPKTREWRRFVRKEGRRLIATILKSPDFVLYDSEENAVIYARKITYKGKVRMAGVVVGFENKFYIFTVKPMTYPPSARYDIIYQKEEEQE